MDRRRGLGVDVTVALVAAALAVDPSGRTAVAVAVYWLAPAWARWYRPAGHD